MKQTKQLNCHLHSIATEELQKSVSEEMDKKDRSLKELLDEKSTTEDTEETST